MKQKILLAFALTCFNFSAFSQAADANSLLWKLSKPGTSTPSWLFGTIHVAKKDVMNFKDSLYYAINNTDAIYTELDLTKETSRSSLLKSMGPMIQHMDSLMKTDSWVKFLERTNRKYGTKLDTGNVDGFSQLMKSQGGTLFEKDPGVEAVDIMIAKYALSLGKKTGALESMEAQIGLLSDLLELVVTDSTTQLNDRSTLEDGLQRFYIEERVDSITALYHSLSPAFRNLMLTQRNRTMADSMEKLVAKQPSFFAVGSGHLVGDDGLVSLLRKKGFIVSPVLSQKKISLLVINQITKSVKKGMTGDEDVMQKADDEIAAPVEEVIPNPKTIKKAPLKHKISKKKS